MCLRGGLWNEPTQSTQSVCRAGCIGQNGQNDHRVGRNVQKHPLYGKRVKYSKKYKAHDEHNIAKVGDIVKIMETRPLSATKRFRLVEVIEKSVVL